MKEKEISDALRGSMNAVHLSPELRAKTLYAMRGSEERSPKMKRKFSVALVFALAAVLAVAVALAVANRKGVLDFLSYSEATLPENAADYVQTDIAAGEQDGLRVAVREAVYDGRSLWVTVDVNMDGEKPLLTGLDYGMDDNWAWLRHDESEMDNRTIQEVYQSEGYTDAYDIAANGYDESDDMGTWSGEVHLQDDGTLTFYQSIAFEQEKAEREITESVRAFKFEEKDGKMMVNQNPSAEMKLRFTVKAADTQAQTGADAESAQINVEPVEYQDVGVRVDRLTVMEKPLELEYVIEYTVVDAEKFKKADGGLWFEFIDPNSTETEPYAQRLKEGFSSTGGVAPVDETHYRQTGTLSLDEKAESYTLRAYECWEKQRFDTHEVQMKKAE